MYMWQVTPTYGDYTDHDGGHCEVWALARALLHNGLHLIQGDTQDAALIEGRGPLAVIQGKGDDLLHSLPDHLDRGGSHDDRQHHNGNGLQLGAA